MPPSQSQSLRTKLKFKEKLIVKGAGASTDVLLKKLKSLHEELSELDPDATDLNSLSSVRTELIHRSILFHKDPGVKAFAACCIADILKFYAPDAPYDSRGIRDIFTFILTLLSQQLTPSRSTSSGARQATHPTKNEFYKQYYYLIESMSTCKSVILMLDAEENDEEGGGAGEDSLVSRMFKEFFDLVRYDLPRTLTDHMTDILTTLIDEAATVSPEVRKILLDQFDKDRPSHHPRALELAVAVCEYDYPSQKIERSIAQYFLEILIQAPSHDRADSPTPSSSDRSSSPPPHSKSKNSISAFAHSVKPPAISSATKDAILSAHSLIRSLAQYCPIPLLSTLPILESELETSDVFHRLLAVETLGEVFGSARGAEVVSKAKKTWVAWLGRGKDAEWKIRRGWVEKVGKMMSGKGPELKAELEPLLKIKLCDPEEHVRDTTCKIFGHLDYETTLHHVSKATLKDLSSRMMDRKNPVRGSAIHSVAKLYSLAFPEIEDGDPAAISLLGWIPNDIISCASVSSAAVREVIEQTLLKWVLPLPVKGDEEVAWVDKVLLVMRGLDDKSKAGLLVIAGFNAIRSKWPGFIHACQQYNGGIMDENEDKITADLNRVVREMASQFPDPAKATSDLKKFAEANEDRLYKVLKSAMDPQTDLKNLVKLNAEFVKRCPPELLPTMSIVLRRCSYPFINKTSIPTLLKRLQKTSSSSLSSSEAASDASNNAKLILVTISKKSPAMYKSHVSELGKVILDEKSGTKVAEVPLQALAHLERLDSSSQTGDKKVLDRATHFALKGTARQAKFAIRLIAYSKKADELAPDLAETLASSLADDDDKLLFSHLTALSEMARSAPDAFEEQSELVTKFILDKFANPDENNKDDEDEWIDEEELTARAKAKLVSLKLCANRCASHARTNEAATLATPVINVFLTILTKRGTFASLTDGSNIKTRVRLQAGRSLLKLAIYPVYAKLISPSFLVLAVLVQDPCFWVRLQFVKKLSEALHANKLPPSYNVMLFLAAHDEPEVRNIAKSTILRCMQTAATVSQELKVDNYIFIFVRLIHLLAHHPDYTNEPDDLKSIAKYLEFYLDLVMAKENVSLLYALSAKVKTVKDRNPEYSRNLYAVGELAQHIIQARTRAHNWTIDNYPGKISMPGDLFRPLGGNEDVQKNMIKIYLPEETLKTFKKELGKTVKDIKPRVKKASTSNGEKRTPIKRKAANGSLSAKKRAAKKKRQSDSSDEDPPSETEDEEEEEEDDASPPPKKLPTKTAPTTNGKGKGKALAPSSKNGTLPAKGKKKVVKDSDEEEEDGDEEMKESGSEEEEENDEEVEVPVLGRGGRRKPAAVAPEVKKSRPKPKPRRAKPKGDESDAMDED